MRVALLSLLGTLVTSGAPVRAATASSGDASAMPVASAKAPEVRLDAAPVRPASFPLPRERLSTVSLDDGALLIVDVAAPANAQTSAMAVPPAQLSLRSERLAGGRMRLKFAAVDGRCLPRVMGGGVVCRRPNELESRARVSAMVRHPIEPGDSESAAEIAKAERLLATDDLDGAGAIYTGLRRGYATRALADLRLADVMWLSDHAGDAIAEWGRAAVRFGRRAEGRLAALRVAAAAWHLEGSTPAALPAVEKADAPLAAAVNIARALLLGDLGRYEEALEAVRELSPAGPRSALDNLRQGLVAAGIRLTSVRGQPMRTVLLFRRHFAVVRSHPERVDLELATANALLDLDLVQEAVEVVDDALVAATTDAEQARVGAWINGVRTSLASPEPTAPGAFPAHPLAARLASLQAEVDATLGHVGVRQ